MGRQYLAHPIDRLQDAGIEGDEGANRDSIMRHGDAAADCGQCQHRDRIAGEESAEAGI